MRVTVQEMTTSKPNSHSGVGRENVVTCSRVPPHPLGSSGTDNFCKSTAYSVPSGSNQGQTQAKATDT